MTEQAPFRMVVEYWRDRILSGKAKAGERIPPRDQLRYDHGDDRFPLGLATIDRAMGILAAEGLIVVTPRQHTVVADISLRHSTVLDRARSHRSTGEALSESESSKIIYVNEEEPCPPEFSHLLEVEANHPVLMRKRVSFVNGNPVAMGASLYPPFVSEATPELSRKDSLRGSRELACERIDSPQKEMMLEITGRSPNDEERKNLRITAETFVLQANRCVVTEDDRVVEVGYKVSPAYRPIRIKCNLS